MSHARSVVVPERYQLIGDSRSMRLGLVVPPHGIPDLDRQYKNATLDGSGLPQVDVTSTARWSVETGTRAVHLIVDAEPIPSSLDIVFDGKTPLVRALAAALVDLHRKRVPLVIILFRDDDDLERYNEAVEAQDLALLQSLGWAVGSHDLDVSPLRVLGNRNKP